MKTEQKILVTDFRAANSELTQREVRRECCVNVGKLLSRKDHFIPKPMVVRARSP